MNHKLLAAALCCIVLLGCGSRSVSPLPGPNRLAPTKETENDNLRCYPLDAANCRFFGFGEDLLLLIPSEFQTELLRYSGKALRLAGNVTLPGQDWAVSAARNTVCCYSGGSCWLLNRELAVLKQIVLPGCIGPPVFCPDGCHLYYSTEDAVMELDVHTDLHRKLRDGGEPVDAALFLPGSALLVCSRDGESLYLSAEDGSLRTASPEVSAAAVFSGREYLAVRCGENDCLYLGQSVFPLEVGWRFCAFLPGMNGAMVYQSGQQQIAVYDLTTGNRIAGAAMKEEPRQTVVTEDGRIFFLGNDALWQWNPVPEPKQVMRSRIVPLDSIGSTVSFTQCRQLAVGLEQRYGITVLLGDAVGQLHPKGAVIQPEPIAAIVSDTLLAVEKALSRYPAEWVRQVLHSTGQTCLYPVRRIRQGGENMAALQFWNGRDCCLAVAATERIEEAVAQLLTPLIDRQVAMQSDLYDGWDITSAQRAALLHAAMETGNREYFLDANNQNSLRRFAQAMRAVYPQSLGTVPPWEQYLWK